MQTEVFPPFELDTATTTWLMGLVVVFVVLGIWSSLTRQKAGGGLGLKAKNLFLTVRTGAGFQIHIVTLGTRDLSFVSPKYVAKGEHLSLNVDTLPGFAAGSAPLDVEVTRAQPMRGQKDSFVISARIAAKSQAERTELRHFLEQLARPGRLSHA